MFRVLRAGWISVLIRNTRVLVLLQNLKLNQGETASAVMVHLVDNSNQSYDVTAEDVRVVPNFDLAQVTLRLTGQFGPPVRAQCQ